jgi:hypothetical protein
MKWKRFKLCTKCFLISCSVERINRDYAYALKAMLLAEYDEMLREHSRKNPDNELP